MDYVLESKIWMTAQQVMEEGHFQSAVPDAVASYKRLPGYAGLERLHIADIGASGMQTLRRALEINGHHHANDPQGYVSLRAPLRVHLLAELQWRLIAACRASSAMIDGYFARDLGL